MYIQPKAIAQYEGAVDFVRGLIKAKVSIILTLFIHS